MSSESSSFGSSGVYVGTDWQVRCSTYPASTPILTIDAGHGPAAAFHAATSLVSPPGRPRPGARIPVALSE